MGIRLVHCSAALLLFPFVQAPARVDEPALAKRLKEIEQRFDEERHAWLDFRAQVKSAEERAALVEAFPRDEFASQLTALAAEAKGTDVAALAWVDIYRLGKLLEDHELYERGIERVTSDCLSSSAIAGFTLELVYPPPTWGLRAAEDGLRKILAGSSDGVAQQSAMAELALLVGNDDSLGEAGRTEAFALLERIRATYADKDFIGMSGKEFADGARYEIEHLRVGQVAPDFTLKDQDGQSFKLSDYRGRVVLLDFWGFV